MDRSQWNTIRLGQNPSGTQRKLQQQQKVAGMAHKHIPDWTDWKPIMLGLQRKACMSLLS